MSGDDRVPTEIHRSPPKVNLDLVFGAIVAVKRAPRFTPQDLLDAIGYILDGTGATASFGEKMKQAVRQQKFSLLRGRLNGPPNAILRVNGLNMLVVGGDEPAFAGKALEERINPALWSDGVQRLSQTEGNVMIADAYPSGRCDPDLNYDRAAAVTVTAAAVSLLTDPAGMIWHPAGNAIPTDLIPDMVQSLADGVAPLPLWLRWMPVPPTHGRKPGAASRGLQAFLGRELELVANEFSLEKNLDDLFQIAAALLRTGTPPPDGSQIITKDQTRYRVVHRQRGVMTGTPIFRLISISDYKGG